MPSLPPFLFAQPYLPDPFLLSAGWYVSEFLEFDVGYLNARIL